MKFEQVCQPLNQWFSQHPIFRVLLPLSMPLMFLCAGLRVLDNFISLGNAVITLTFLGFFLFLLLVVSTCDFRMTAAGLALFTLDYLIGLLSTLIRVHSLPWGSLIYVLVFGYLAFLAYRKSMSMKTM